MAERRRKRIVEQASQIDSHVTGAFITDDYSGSDLSADMPNGGGKIQVRNAITRRIQRQNSFQSLQDKHDMEDLVKKVQKTPIVEMLAYPNNTTQQWKMNMKEYLAQREMDECTFQP